MERFYFHFKPTLKSIEGFFILPYKDIDIHKQNILKLMKSIRYFKKADFLNVEYIEHERKIFFKVIVNDTEWKIKEKTNLFFSIIEYIQKLDYTRSNINNEVSESEI